MMEIVEIGNSNLTIADGNYSAKYPRSDEFVDKGVPFIRANNFKGKTIVDDDLYFIKPEKHAELKKGHVKPRDILITTRGNIGKVVLVPERHDDSNINAQIVLLRCNKGWHPEYLLHALSSDFVAEQIPPLTTGTALKQLPVKSLKKLKIPLPPLETQKKIAAILDAADVYRQKTKALITKYDELTQSLFLDMFGDPVRNEKGWEKVKFSEVGKLDRGKSKHRPRNAPELLGGDHPLIQTGDLANCGIYLTKFKSTYSDIGLKQSKKWPKGTLCITIAANIAKTGILDFDACFPDSVVGFVPNEKANSVFVLFWMSFLQKILEDSAPESAQKNINLAILKDLDFLLIPINLQNQFAERVQKIEVQKAQAQESLEKSEELFNSLLQRAFKGELI